MPRWWGKSRQGLTSALSLSLALLKQRRRGHDPGVVIQDLAVMLADGGGCIWDLGTIREQDALFALVACDQTSFIGPPAVRAGGWLVTAG